MNLLGLKDENGNEYVVEVYEKPNNSFHIVDIFKPVEKCPFELGDLVHYESPQTTRSVNRDIVFRIDEIVAVNKKGRFRLFSSEHGDWYEAGNCKVVSTNEGFCKNPT